MTERVNGTKHVTNYGGNKALFIFFICLIIAAGIIAAIIITTNFVTFPDRAVKGVTISGIDVSGKTKDQVLAATSQIPDDLLANAEISISFNGDTKNFSAQDLGLTTDYDSVVEQAMAYGHSTGDGSQASATSNGNFTVHIVADKTKITSVITPIAEKYNKQAVNATAQFMPWGYLSDGTQYQPDTKAIIKACANGKAYSEPSDLVRLTTDQVPNKLRYEYWQNNHYVADYTPADANISRFLYKGEETGQTVDTDSLVNSVVTQAESGDKSTISANIQTIKPEVTLADLKNNTQLIASWTSSFSKHLSYNRNWNVAKLSSIINGVVIQPGQTWSINKEAGDRTVANGWLEAAGIELGGFTQQPGGGVCQISSTLYNAAIRSALTVADSSHHSISSDYIPLGLDATISTGGPDLQLKNTYDTPVYIVSYVNPTDHNVTVEIYGQPVNDSKYGNVILDFSFVDGGSFGTPGMNYVYNAASAPDGTQIAAGQSYVYAIPRQGRSVQTYKYYISLEGKQLGVDAFQKYTWNPTNGTTYVNGAAPAATPTPAAAAAASPSAAASTASTSTSTDSQSIPSAPVLND